VHADEAFISQYMNLVEYRRHGKV